MGWDHHKVAPMDGWMGRDMVGAAVDIVLVSLGSSWWRLDSDSVEQIHFLLKYSYKDS